MLGSGGSIRLDVQSTCPQVKAPTQLLSAMGLLGQDPHVAWDPALTDEGRKTVSELSQPMRQYLVDNEKIVYVFQEFHPLVSIDFIPPASGNKIYHPVARIPPGDLCGSYLGGGTTTSRVQIIEMWRVCV